MYGIFVCVVLVADIYHRTVVLPRIQALQEAHANDTVEEAANQISSPDQGPSEALSRVMTAISNYDNVCGGGDQTFEGCDDAWGITSPTLSSPKEQGAALQASDAPIILHGQNGLLTPEHHSRPTDQEHGGAAEDQGPGGSYELVRDQMDQLCVADTSEGFRASNWSGAFYDGRQEVMASIREAWEDITYNGDLNIVEKAMLICEFPFTVMRKVTVSIPCEGSYNRGLVALSMALCPLWFAYYIWVGHEVNLLSKQNLAFFIFLEVFAIVSASIVMRYAPGGSGTMALTVAAPIALVGFVIAASWIDYLADHLVSLLDFIGIILHIPGSVMGLTVLALGNSMGDLSSNMTMARKGFANMAMTACFAGPVFNILFGLGLGFIQLASQTGQPEAAVSVSGSVLTGFVFVILNCTMLILTGVFMGKGRIEVSYGYVALGLYTTYVVVSIGLEFLL
jgi:sodium/potassium/calcium exchanger 6